MIMAPRRIRAEQVFQVFATLLRMEFGQESINIRVSIVRDDREYASSVVKFERPSSRIVQLQVRLECVSLILCLVSILLNLYV